MKTFPMPTSMKITNAYRKRAGITLLFVISMIVLFLLMGTTFVVVSNDFLRESQRRARHDVGAETIDGTADLDKGIYDVLRGPSLDDTSSPLRVQDLLSDMYGYGFRAIVLGTPATVGNGQFVRLSLGYAGTPNEVLDLRSNAVGPLSKKPDHYTGHLLSFVSGPFVGLTTRIIDYEVTGTTHTFTIMPAWTTGDLPALTAVTNSEVIVNGRPFAGYGAGGFTDAGEGNPALGPKALEPNRVGETRDQLTGAGGYAADYLSANESYDAPDIQNPFLAGRDVNGGWIASFYRPSVANANPGGPANRGMFAAFANAKTGTEYEVDTDNDGYKDSIWIDIGAPIRSNGNGIFYKPLYAYKIVDQDGLLNLNAHGNLAEALDAAPVPQYAGQGYGPAEVSLKSLLPPAEYRQILQGGGPFPAPFLGPFPGRLGSGAAATAGVNGTRDDWSARKMFGYPEIGDTQASFFASSPPNIRGRFVTGTMTAPISFPDPNPGSANFNNNLPVTDVSTAGANDTLADSPYEANFAPAPFSKWDQASDDQPFTAVELERWLRSNDADSNLLPSRLVALAQTAHANTTTRHSLTTDSYEVPMAPFLTVNSGGNLRPLADVLYAKLGLNPDTDVDQMKERARELLSPELLRGMKMDINRPFGNGRDDNNNGVVDDPSEYGVPQNNRDLAGNPEMQFGNMNLRGAPTWNDDLARYQFMKHLYVLTLLVTEDSNSNFANVVDYRRAVAQWVVNVVDFRDPDSIMTPFEYDPNPWNGWTPDGRLQPDEVDGPERAVVWGVERPELLLTETFAHHDRALEDTDLEADSVDPANNNKTTDDPDNPDQDFDSRLVPRSSAFFELYHPWTQDSTNQRLPAELADNAANPTGVDLKKLAPGGRPVWRLAVKRNPADAAILRTIYFTDTSALNEPVDPEGGEEFYSTLGGNAVVTPGQSAVIGSMGSNQDNGGPYRTTFGRRIGVIEPNLELSETRSMTLDPVAGTVSRVDWTGVTKVTESKTATVVVIDGPRSLSLSDPSGGYADYSDAAVVTRVGDGFAFTEVRDIPVDEGIADANDRSAIWTNGVTRDFRTVYLQRLANPLLAFNKDTNPYLTIDAAQADLLAFNGMANNPSNGDPHPNERNPANGLIDTTKATDFRSLERGESQTAQTNQLFARDLGAGRDPGVTTTGDNHNLSYEFKESFGEINEAYRNNAGVAFAWLTWNNRPFVSQYELANVPFAAPEHLTALFSLRNTFDPYTTPNPATPADPAIQEVVKLGSQFGHLLNFYGHDDAATPAAGNFYRLFDYTEVPSRFTGTETWLNQTHFPNHPFNFVSHYRYPGKINLNTIPNQQVYEALMGSFSTQPSASWAAFNQSRWNGNDFRPYRNTGEGNLVPQASMVMPNVDCGLYRRDSAGAPIFDFNDTNVSFNSDRSAYFRNQMRQRLGNLVTTRSSVFAIWITVGYFEVNPDGLLKPGAGKGVELGAEIGEANRHRGFYIFDRSIPVAYEPGKNHNIDRAIIVRTVIE